MALSRKFLSAMGIEADKIDEIIDAHSETVNALKEERDSFKKDAEKYKKEADKIPDIQKELDDLKESAAKNEKDPFKVKYEALKEEFDNYKNDISAKETKSKKEKAYRNLLKEAGISEKRIDAVLRVSDDAISGIEFDDEGKVKDSDSLKKAITDDWSDFIQTKETKGAKSSNPPAGGQDESKKTGLAAKIAAEYHDNLYGSVKEDK